MSDKIKGAFWPQAKKVPSASLQRDLGCDPRVATFFPTDMVKKTLQNEPTWVFEATEAQWRKMAEKWRTDDSFDFRDLSGSVH